MTINKMLSKTDKVPQDVAHFIWAYCKRDLSETEMRCVIAFITRYHVLSRQQKLELTGRMPVAIVAEAVALSEMVEGPKGLGSKLVLGVPPVADSTLEK